MTCTPQTNTTLIEIAQVLRTRDNFVISGHVGPDGDCLGSQLALMHALHTLGKRAICVRARDEAIDASMSLLPGIELVGPACEYTGAVDTFISVDCPTCERLGDASHLHDKAQVCITIDHHAVDSCMAQYNYVDPDAPATGMLIWELIRLLVDYPSPQMATCCYVALMTDTGRFAYQNATAYAFQMAYEMVQAGAHPAHIAQEVYQNRSRASLYLEKRALDHMYFSPSAPWVLSYVTAQDFKETEAVKADAEPLVDLLRSISGVVVACMVREYQGSIRMSLRSKSNDIDVSILARKFHGGGHKVAAGCSFDGSLEQALRELPDHLDALFA